LFVLFKSAVQVKINAMLFLVGTKTDDKLLDYFLGQKLLVPIFEPWKTLDWEKRGG
jgi:hypothetical protein